MVRELTTVVSAALPINERWTIKRCRYAPEDGGTGRVCLATGIHGDEMMGQLVVYAVAKRIREQPEALRGTVDMYPMLNPLGMDIGQRMVPTITQLDMNRAFPGNPNGTPMEMICAAVFDDMKGADLVLDIHASTQHKSEMYEVRLSAESADRLLPKARALCPELIWVFPEKSAFRMSLAGSLCEAGTDAMVIEADERYMSPQDIAKSVVEGIFCKLKEMGIWAGEAPDVPADDFDSPVVRSEADVCRVSCEEPGIYVPKHSLGSVVEAGDVLGAVIDALRGDEREMVKAPCRGLVFSQRSYSAVYPGTLIARIRKEQP